MMPKDDEWFWYHTDKKIDDLWRLKDVEKKAKVDRFAINLGGAPSGTPERSPSEEALLADMRVRLKALQDKISDCADLRSSLRDKWLGRLDKIVLSDPGADAKLLELASDVQKTGDEEHLAYVKQRMLSTAASLDGDIKIIVRRLEKLAAMAQEYQDRFRP